VANDFPQIVDKSTLTGVFQTDSFFGIGVEGEMGDDGEATVGMPVVVSSVEEAVTQFGEDSSLTNLVQFILGRGLNYVKAVASASGSTPNLGQRQDAWAPLEEDPTIRIRLTDDDESATHVALAESCENADLIQHKQFCVVGLAGPAVKATTVTVAGAINSKRAVLFDPGVFDNNGVLQEGAYAAAYGACELAKNPDISDSLNLAPVPATTGIEKDTTTGLPVYRLRTNGGDPIDDFQDLLDAGASPYMQGPDGRASFTHIRTTFTDDDTFDALVTLLAADGLFLGIRDLLLNAKFLRSGNTATNRSLASQMVNSYLKGQSNIVSPIELPDNTTGFGVSVTPSEDLKAFTVAYFGQIVRGTNVININGTLTIPVGSVGSGS
jgi:hypothetical protein